MIGYNSFTGTISFNGASRYSDPAIKDQTGIVVYYNSSDNIIEFHQQGKIIHTKSVPPVSLPATIKEEKRTDQTYTDILELFAEHQEQSEAEEEQINNLSIKYFLECDIK